MPFPHFWIFTQVHPFPPFFTLYLYLQWLFGSWIMGSIMSLCMILPISLNCAMPVIPSQVAFEFAIKFSSGRSHQLTRVDVAGEAKNPPEGE